MTAKASKSKKKRDINDDMAAYNEVTAPKRNLKVIFFVVWILIIVGLLGAFVLTTNQNIGDGNVAPVGSDQAAADLSTKLKPLEERLDKNPKDIAALVDIGFLYIDGSRFAEAAENFTKAIKLDEKNIDAIIGLGMASQYQSQPNKALEQYDKALKMDPNNDFAKVRKGYFLAQVEKKYAEALELLREVEAKQQIGNLKTDLKNSIAEIEKLKPAAE